MGKLLEEGESDGKREIEEEKEEEWGKRDNQDGKGNEGERKKGRERY